MKENILYSIYGVAFLLFVGFGWSIVEQPTFGNILILAACFGGLFLGAKLINKLG